MNAVDSIVSIVTGLPFIALSLIFTLVMIAYVVLQLLMPIAIFRIRREVIDLNLKVGVLTRLLAEEQQRTQKESRVTPDGKKIPDDVVLGKTI
jgi:hypothetical protein